MEGSPAPGETSRVGTTDSPPVESATYRLSVHQGVVRDVFREGVGQNLVSTLSVSTHGFGGSRLPFEHRVLDLYDETRNQESDRTCHLRSWRQREIECQAETSRGLCTPLGIGEVCEKLEDLVLELDREVSDWKDRFLFDALEAHEDDLCSDCKESLRVTFYVTDDRSQALKWKPHGEGRCCQKECKCYKMNIFDDANVESDVREVPIEYDGYSDLKGMLCQ